MTLILALLAASLLPQMEAQRAAERIQQAHFQPQLDALAAQALAQDAYQQAAVARALQEGTVHPAPPVALAPPAPALSPVDQAELRALLERGARCVTGRVVYDRESGFWVPAFRPNCLDNPKGGER
jgi:hypothetical protein